MNSSKTPESSPECLETFSDLVRRFEGTRAAVPFLIEEGRNDALANGKGAYYEFSASERGEGGYFLVTTDEITFRVGDRGPHTLSVAQAVEIILPPDPTH